MSDNPNPTADYRKYAKGPNFLGIVIGACVFILIAFVIAYFFLRRDAGKMVPHGPSKTPNAELRLEVSPGVSWPLQAAA